MFTHHYPLDAAMCHDGDQDVVEMVLTVADG